MCKYLLRIQLRSFGGIELKVEEVDHVVLLFVCLEFVLFIHLFVCMFIYLFTSKICGLVYQRFSTEISAQAGCERVLAKGSECNQEGKSLPPLLQQLATPLSPLPCHPALSQAGMGQ